MKAFDAGWNSYHRGEPKPTLVLFWKNFKKPLTPQCKTIKEEEFYQFRLGYDAAKLQEERYGVEAMLGGGK